MPAFDSVVNILAGFLTSFVHPLYEELIAFIAHTTIELPTWVHNGLAFQDSQFLFAFRAVERLSGK